jgi:hypothetical protein
MSHEFKYKFDQMRENYQEQPDQTYAGESNVRNVCFVQADGKMTFLNYSYLVSGEYQPEESIIVLNFTSHTIILKGTKLEMLYQEFFSQVPRFITTTEERYNEVEKNSYLINEMQITEK